MFLLYPEKSINLGIGGLPVDGGLLAQMALDVIGAAQSTIKIFRFDKLLDIDGNCTVIRFDGSSAGDL